MKRRFRDGPLLFAVLFVAVVLIVIAVQTKCNAVSAESDTAVVLSNPESGLDIPKVGTPGTNLAKPGVSESVRECRYLWQKINPETYDPELAAWFVECHRRAGVEERYYHSLIYCWSGADLKPTMKSRDTINGEHARGLVDTLWSTHRGHLPWVRATVEARGLAWNEQVLHDPYVAVRLHVIELMEFYDPDHWRNLRKVFLPRYPDGERAYREQRNRWEWRDEDCQEWLAEMETP